MIGYPSLPWAVVLPTAIVIVEVPLPGAAIGLGLKPTVVPVGAPVADRVDRAIKSTADSRSDGARSLGGSLRDRFLRNSADADRVKLGRTGNLGLTPR